MYTLYMHFNRLNGKKYIGITGRSLNSRFGKDGSGYKGCTVFWNAIQKYGWDNFEHRILKVGLTEEEAKDLEKKYIAAFQTNDRRFGYNLLEGGQGGPMPQETKERMSKSAIGKPKSEKVRKKMSEASPQKEPVVCVDTGEIFESVRDAAKKMGGTQSTLTTDIKRGCRFKGLLFEYVDPEKKEKMNSIRSVKERRKKKVICVETGEIFDSAMACAKKQNRSQQSVVFAIKNNGSCNGLHFEFYTIEKGE